MVDNTSRRPVPAASRGAARRHRVEGGRSIAVKIRFTDAEYAEIAAGAENAQVSVQRFLVARALPQSTPTQRTPDAQRRSKAPSPLTAELAGLRRLVANLANNINQIARRLNSGGPPDSSIPVAMDAVRRAMHRVDNALATLEPGGEATIGIPPRSAIPRITGPQPRTSPERPP